MRSILVLLVKISLNRRNKSETSFETLFYNALSNIFNSAIKNEGKINILASHILTLIGFTSEDFLVSIRQPIPFFMSGVYSIIEVDVAIFDRVWILLLVQENKTWQSEREAEPQLIAEAIDACASSFLKNGTREDDGSKVTLPCIIMKGSYPTFYKITISYNLTKLVKSGLKPSYSAEIYKFSPLKSFDNADAYMLDRESRIYALKAFKAFKKIFTH